MLISLFLEEFLPDLTVLDDKAISHSLADFSFAKDAFSLDSTAFMNATYRDDSHDVDDDDDFGGGFPDAPMDVDMGGNTGAANTEDFFVGDQAVGDDYGGMDMGGDDQGGFENGDDTEGGDKNRAGAFEPFDPRRAPNEHDLVMAMTEAGAEGGSLDYFDQSFLKNWAGPEHWKLRKIVRRRKLISPYFLLTVKNFC